MPIDRLVIDSSDAISELCELGQETQADKSPYNSYGHRHPYTAVYTMLLASMKGAAIRFAEIGVARGCSAHMWSKYFTNPDAKICMFDRDNDFLEHAVKRVQDTRMSVALMDVGVDGDVARALGDLEYDVVLDDSSHEMGHQIRIIHEAFPKLKKGGLMIVEDVFKSIPEEAYEKELQEILPQCAAAYFVVCEHKWRWSPGWDNDKLLVLVKA